MKTDVGHSFLEAPIHIIDPALFVRAVGGKLRDADLRRRPEEAGLARNDLQRVEQHGGSGPCLDPLGV